MPFRILGLTPAPFTPFYGLPEAALAAHNIIRCIADATPGFPCRIELREAEPGESVLLLNHVSQPADTPYRASHAIFVREGATTTYDEVDQVPAILRTRLLSLRGFDSAGLMRNADITEGARIEHLIAALFADPAVETIHAHNAKRGCYACRIIRAW